MTNNLRKQFGLFRSFFWPIHAHEIPKILPMMLMLFLICFNQTTLRNMKDALVITTSGAAVIPYIKVGVMLPMAVLTTFIFTRLSNRFSQETVFYIVVGAFLSYFMFFVFVGYPLREWLHPVATADFLEEHLPSGARGLVEMYRHWTFTLFYVASELWGTMVLSVGFWAFANEVTKLAEANRFYGVFGVVSNLATTMAGLIPLFAAKSNQSWEQLQMMLILIIIAFGIITAMVFRWMNTRVLNDPAFDQLHVADADRPLKKKKKISFRESFSHVSKSKYLVYIAIIVLFYNLGINLVELIWKEQLRFLNPEPLAYLDYQAHLTFWIGIVSTCLALPLARMIERLGWTGTAMITPIVMLITSIGFFSFLLFPNTFNYIFTGVIATSALTITVSCGSLQNLLCRSCKFSLFDATKEMAYIPLDHDSKLKGKAAIDGIGSRLGKSGGSFIHVGLLMALGTLQSSAPYVACILLVGLILWMLAISALGKEVNTLLKKTKTDASEEPLPEGEPVLSTS